ncbi:MAG: hypothetical protein ISS66_16490 [Desulfobacteraceae bacterium]|nr:hypothetical protein [Desulfobacteraceae bacterium]
MITKCDQRPLKVAGHGASTNLGLDGHTALGQDLCWCGGEQDDASNGRCYLPSAYTRHLATPSQHLP